jgi:hypothetical protein
VKIKLVWAALLFSIAFSAISLPRVFRLDSPDFKVFHVAAKHALYQPENLYKISPDRYLYPPVTAILLAPFGFSDNWKFHQLSWHLLLSLVLLFFCQQSWAFFWAIIILNRYFSINFGYGQINPIVLFFVFLTTISLKKENSKLASVSWPLASILKVYPLVQGLEFIQHRRWRELFYTFGVFFFLLSIPFLFWGIDLALELHFQFFQALQAKGLPIDSGNQSLSALAVRLFTAQPFQLHPLGEYRWGWILLPPLFVKYLPLLLGLVFTFITWQKAWKRKGFFDGASAFGFSLLFLSHIVWKDYFIFLLFPIAQIIQLQPRGWKQILGIYLAFVYLSSPDLITHQVSARLDALSLHFFAAIWIWFHWLKIQSSSNERLSS